MSTELNDLLFHLYKKIGDTFSPFNFLLNLKRVHPMYGNTTVE